MNARKVVFANGKIYHIFNRGVEKRPTFTDKRELSRATETLKYYRFADLPIRLSHFINLDNTFQHEMLKTINISQKHVEILAYCFMPNHFHFLLKQINDNGISKFIANFTNSYTKYFNTKHDRVGHLFQGTFKAVHVSADEQLLHLARYIHLNPISSFLIETDALEHYPWSSHPAYVNSAISDFIEKDTILNFFPNLESYKQFLLDQVDYARTLESIKHLALE